VKFLAPATITYGLASSRPLGEAVQPVVGLVAVMAEVWEGSPKRNDEVATSWPQSATDLHIVHRWNSIARLFVLEYLPGVRRETLLLRRALGRAPARFYIGNSVQIQTSVLSAEPPTSILPRTLRGGVGVMHSHFSNGNTLTAVPSWATTTAVDRNAPADARILCDKNREITEKTQRTNSWREAKKEDAFPLRCLEFIF